MSAVKLLKARYAGTCPRCRGPIRIGEMVMWSIGSHLTTHFKCPTNPEENPPDQVRAKV